MSSITNINNNSSVVNVGRTTPVAPGQQPASRSIPVVLASDQSPVPVEEQNKVQSEVALSLLGIPRAEVALGIFADVNTYDVNPTEWSKAPQYYLQGHGIKHLPNEAGALVEAPRDQVAVLTSKRFFRYQPGRVSAATFGVKSTVSQAKFAQNATVHKYGIFDNYDGYYWESRNNGTGDNFTVVRRTQSLLVAPPSPYGVKDQPLRGSQVDANVNKIDVEQLDDYRIVGKAASAPLVSPALLKKDRKALQEARFTVAADAIATAVSNYSLSGTQTTSGGNTYEAGTSFYADLAAAINVDSGGSTTADEVEAKCYRDVDYWIDMILSDMEWGGNAHTIYNTHNFETAILPMPGVYELSIYTALKNEIDGLGLTEDESGVLALVDLIIDRFDPAQSNPTISSADLGSKPKIDTMYDVKKQFWGYFAAKAIPYVVPAEGLSSGLTEEDIYYKCQRDVGYLIDGYKNDIAGGGNAETVYNMSMFLREAGMSVYSQTDGNGDLYEIARHTALKTQILSDIVDFGYASGSSVYAKQEDLIDRVIENFKVESTLTMETGNRGFAGNLVTLRDGLIMLHAGAFDANVLKDRESILTVSGADNKLKLSKGHVTFGQHVRHVSGISELDDNGIYKVAKVFGPKGNEFTLVNEDGTAQTVADGQTGYFETVVPFIIPNTYNPEHYAGDGDNAEIVYPNSDTLDDVKKDEDPFVAGMMFPYMYSSNSNLLDDSDAAFYVGYINTAKTDVATVRKQIDDVNFTPEYINWVKNNVKPEYWGVYEYRIPRSRFSHDRLDGVADVNAAATYRVFSDKATGETGTAYPGQIVTDEGVGQLANSEYDFDFTKVSMLKIEFSWYGAVGALFLAYVPIGNGEARWVRVHHLRASNQLKIASLGNATLPITYNVYGGGTTVGLGDGEENSTPSGANYSTQSHNIVKYGASYYIDGGDRGTVRLYSHNNDDTVSAYGKQFTVTGYATSGSGSNQLVTVNSPTGIDPTFFIGAKVSTASPLDQNIRVTWADPDTNKVFLSAPLNNTSSIKLIPDRANTVYGIETKREILSTIDANAVRNRVQVYPTKLSTSNLGDNPVRLRMKKTPKFQDDTSFNGTISLTADHEINSQNNALPVTESATFLQNEESIYGWFKGEVGVNSVTAFGRLYKSSGSYYFELLESYAGTVVLLNGGDFLPERRFDAEGNILTGTSKISVEKEGLSSVKIATDVQVPIPGTGINIATLYLQQGTEQVDLLSYFDYNKEYLSFPLTDIADTLYFAVDSDQASNTSDEISLGITWEEQ
jgi:hypothetical protein